MSDFNKILDQAKEIESKIKESQEKIKKIEAIGISGGGGVKVTLNGEGEMINIEISNNIFVEEKSIVEDLIKAAHSDAKVKLKSKTSEEFNHNLIEILKISKIDFILFSKSCCFIVSVLLTYS